MQAAYTSCRFLRTRPLAIRTLLALILSVEKDHRNVMFRILCEVDVDRYIQNRHL